ncbi:MAG TPA: hypothetical protein V6C99_11495 [Oculatellaceae cyanobacterium]
MQISSSVPSIQTLKAQQAWEARRLRQVSRQETQPESVPAPSAPIADRVAETSVAAFTLPQAGWGETVREVQSIAERVGYIGVTEQDIRRAYTLGESLLADYKV